MVVLVGTHVVEANPLVPMLQVAWEAGVADADLVVDPAADPAAMATRILDMVGGVGWENHMRARSM
jgi:hypothetical protein